MRVGRGGHHTLSVQHGFLASLNPLRPSSSCHGTLSPMDRARGPVMGDDAGASLPSRFDTPSNTQTMEAGLLSPATVQSDGDVASSPTADVGPEGASSREGVEWEAFVGDYAAGKWTGDRIPPKPAALDLLTLSTRGPAPGPPTLLPLLAPPSLADSLGSLPQIGLFPDRVDELHIYPSCSAASIPSAGSDGGPTASALLEVRDESSHLAAALTRTKRA